MPSLEEYVATWLPAIRRTVATQTYRSYEWACRCYIVPALGASALDALTRADVRRFTQALLAANHLRPTTVRLVVQVLRGLLSSAADEEVIAINPARRPGRQFRGMGQAVRPSLAGDALRRFLATSETVVPQMAVLFLFLARTGVRLGEALGLLWEHVDLDTRVAMICQQTWPHGRVTPTKSGRAHFVDLSAQLVLALHRHRQQVVGPWVFPGALGYPYSRSTVRHHFHQVLVSAGLPEHFSPHSLRHGFASTLLRRGEPLEYVRRALNHADPKLTAALYGAHLPNSRLAAVDALDE